MGLFERLSRLLRSNINDLIAKAENPEKMLVQVIEDMRRQLAQAKQEVAMAIADERRLRSQVEQERKEAQNWERRARLAIGQERDDLAKQALMRGQEHARHAAELEEQWLRHREETERLKDSLRQLNAKIEEAKRKKNLLIAKQKRAQAQKRIHETMAGLQDKSAFRAFDQMVEKIEETERRALASAEVTEDLQGDSLEAEFAMLEVGGESDVEDKLLALKRDMGLLAAAEPEEPKALEAGDPPEVAEAEAELVEAEMLEAELVAELEAIEAESGSPAAGDDDETPAESREKAEHDKG
ncbi:MAG: PspA/IM30 family protein [marine benthic group bacterium]|jgi:phage shock protein A|nr:PspA/IM30 family protein [Gemmatimonadota bacterium]MCL7963201.1 PspA/IM30 family protein [Candidatus Carthagonibacter metallireducens]MCL7938455.1 PspA/IM30 family protein [Gemmatimonadota bacterium]MCL7956582.1 PspA/IM30 family protein [Gemmatimonadota bacterium]MCL7965438.1 PspA/IM30 family protein [Gemmatimonadota bacterium]